MEPRPETKRAILLVLTANRGLCGGYNGSILRLAIARLKELQAACAEVQLGGFRQARHLGLSASAASSWTSVSRISRTSPRSSEVDVLADRYLEDFQAGRLDRLDVAYTKFESSSRQQAVVETLLPLGELEGRGRGRCTRIGETHYEFLPSAESILDEVVPASFKVKLFKCFLDAAVSEQIARMVAMKAATENADAMIGSLSIAYNRARQGQITGELLEIIGGAEALNK